jgi:hypothetical protein
MKRKKETAFEALSDSDAEIVAWCWGLYKWKDREDLNRQWQALEKSFNEIERGWYK